MEIFRNFKAANVWQLAIGTGFDAGFDAERFPNLAMLGKVYSRPQIIQNLPMINLRTSLNQSRVVRDLVSSRRCEILHLWDRL